MMKDLLFIDETHQYFLMKDGVAEVELPPLSTILKAVGIVDGRWYTPESAARGKAIHKILEYIDNDELDWGSVDDRVYGWIEAYTKFRENYPFKILESEAPIYHKQNLYACTPDRRVQFEDKTFGLLDFKTGGEEKWHQLQLTAQKEAQESHNRKVDEIWGVYLQENGKFKPPVIYDPDPDTWNAILKVYAWGR